MVKKWSIAFTSAIVALFASVGFSVASMQTQNAQAALSTKGFMIDAAAVRVEDPTGLRFRTQAGDLTAYAKNNSDALCYTTLTFTTGGQEYNLQSKVQVWRPDGSGWNTVLLGIPETDYITQVTAQSFIQLSATECYSTESVTTSIAQTAAGAIAYGATGDALNVLNEYVKNAVNSITLSKTQAKINVGQTQTITAMTAPLQCLVKWTSNAPSVATVDAKGNVTGVSAGEATITATMNGVSASCQVTVTERQELITDFSDGKTVDFITSSGSSSMSSETQKVAYSNYSLSSKTSTFGFATSWLKGFFDNEAVDAISFTVKSDKEITVSTNANALGATYAKGATNKVYISRATYDQVLKAGASALTFSFTQSSFATVNLYFDDFYVVYDDETESATLTRVELENLKGYMPIYVSQEKFDFYAYSSLADDEQLHTVERIKEYKNAGLTVLLPQSACSVNGLHGAEFDFESSKLKQVMDMSAQAELDQVIVSDYRLYSLIEKMTAGEVAFSSTTQLDEYIVYHMQDYASHEAFYGVQLPDEPAYTLFDAYGQVYQAIKRCYPDAFIQCNLFPVDLGLIERGFWDMPSDDQIAKYTALGFDSDNATAFAAFELYLNQFIDATGIEYIMYDAYPMADNGGANGYIIENYVGGMQVAANVAKERGVELHFVSQTMTMQNSGRPDNTRVLTADDLRWLNNMQLGFGVKEMAYFTYFTRENAYDDEGNLVEEFFDNGSFVNRDGTKTELYDAMQEILAQNQAFAPVIKSFDYTTSATYIAENTVFDTTNAQLCTKGNQTEFARLASVNISKESALVTELYDKTNGRYMYMVQNLIDPYYASEGTRQTAKLTFNEDYEYALVYKNGERTVVKLENNTYVVKQNAGEAVYVIPFNPELQGFVFDPSMGDNGAWFPGSANGNSDYDEKIIGFYAESETGDTGAYFPSSGSGISSWIVE